MVVLKRIGVLSTAKISGAVELVSGLAFAVLLLLAGGAAVAFVGPSLAIFTNMGLLVLIVLPLAACLAGFFGNGVFAFIYNVFASWLGGVVFDIKGRRLSRVGAMSLAKLALPAGALVGLLSGATSAVAVSVVAPVALTGAALYATLAVIVVVTVVITAIIFFVGALVGALVYNAAATLIGGVILEISKNGELKGIGVESYAKMLGLFGVIEGLFLGVLYVAMSPHPTLSATLPSAVASLGAISIVAYPVVYLMLGALCGAMGALLYNWFAKRIGGVVLKLK